MGSGSAWETGEVVAFYHLCVKNPKGNNHLSDALYEQGGGAWLKRDPQHIANMKANWFGFRGSDQTLDFKRAVSPPHRDDSFWAEIGEPPVFKKRRKYTKSPPNGRSVQNGGKLGLKYRPSVKIKACKDFLASGDPRAVAKALGMRDPSGLFRWMRDERWNPGLEKPTQVRRGRPPQYLKPAPARALPPPPPTTPEAVAEPTTNGAPITQVTIDDGHDIKITIPIHEHASTVLAKLMELSKQ